MARRTVINPVGRAIAALSRTELEMAMAELCEALYLDPSTDDWNIDLEWDSETVEHAARAIPDRVIAAIRTGSQQSTLPRGVKGLFVRGTDRDAWIEMHDVDTARAWAAGKPKAIIRVEFADGSNAIERYRNGELLDLDAGARRRTGR